MNSCLAGKGISLTNSALKLVAPTAIFRTVAPTRPPNAGFRTREHLTPGEMETLIEAAKCRALDHPGKARGREWRTTLADEDEG
jgi:hypothetical protein